MYRHRLVVRCNSTLRITYHDPPQHVYLSCHDNPRSTHAVDCAKHHSEYEAFSLEGFKVLIFPHCEGCELRVQSGILVRRPDSFKKGNDFVLKIMSTNFLLAIHIFFLLYLLNYFFNGDHLLLGISII